MNNTNFQENILSRNQASIFLGICKTTLDRLDIPRVKVRRRVLYRQTELIRWLDRNSTGNTAQA